jgi:CubicO group peptidase (beta-lactamase class C family)
MTTNTLPRSAPEAQGVPSSAIQAFLASANRDIDYLHSFMLVRHGHVIAEGWWSPFQRDYQHILFSLSKSFTSSAIGFAVQEGLLSLDDTVLSFFPEDAPAQPSDNLKAMKVRHILSMSGGQDVDTTERAVTEPDGNWVRGFLSAPVPFTPGTHFVYNSAATYMCSAIIQKLTGQTLLDYLTPRLFAPLGIEGAWWESDPRGINVGGWGLNIKTDDIAKFGQLYLQKGVWQGKRLLSEAWVNEATSFQVANNTSMISANGSDWEQGYGYQFWRCRHNAYRGDGAFGQYCVVMPDQDAVIAITSGVDDMQAVLNKIWEHLLPAMQSEPLPEDRAAQDALQDALQKLSIPMPAGAKTSAISGAVNGKTYRVEANPAQITSMRVDFNDDVATLTFVDANGEQALPLGLGKWVEGELTLVAGNRFWDHRQSACAGSAAWTNDNTLSATIALTRTPFIPRLSVEFDGDAVKLDFAFDRFMGPTPELHLSGTREVVTA